MSSIATCPDCAAQFALPEFAAADDRARCPKCRTEFLIATARQHNLPVAELLPPVDDLDPQVELLTEPTPEKAADLREFSPEFRAAETIAFSSTTLTGWEERLKRAIESTASEDDGQSFRENISNRATILDDAPEFDFHLDPPEEIPAENFAASPEVLPDTQAWFAGPQAPVPGEVAPAQPPAAPAQRQPRKKKTSLGKRAGVAVGCGLLGLVLGQYALLWLRGPSADYIQLAQLLPVSALPPMLPPARPQHFIPPIAERQNLDAGAPTEPLSPVETITRQLAKQESPPDQPAPPASSPPVRRDEAVQPATVEVPQLRLLPATNTTFDEFSELVASARTAAPALESGDLKSQDAARAKGHAYMAFCHLAERFDFVSDLGLGPDAEREAARARVLFRTTAATVAAESDFALIVTRWWQHRERSSPGIFLVGRVMDAQPLGENVLYQVEVTASQEKTLFPVLVDRGSFQVGDAIGVVGTIVADPHQTFRDLPRAMPQLAVAQDSFAVPGS